jgi:hypothetical protein
MKFERSQQLLRKFFLKLLVIHFAMHGTTMVSHPESPARTGGGPWTMDMNDCQLSLSAYCERNTVKSDFLKIRSITLSCAQGQGITFA